MGNGKPILFLHGWGGSTDSFLGTARRLSERYRCFLLDFTGFGESDAPKWAYTLDDYAEEVEAFIKEKAIEPLIISHSFGGRVAIRLVNRNKVPIKALVLTDSAGLKPRRGLKYRYRVAKYKAAKRKGEDLSGYGSSDYRALNGYMKATFVNIVNEYLDSEINNIHLPTLIIWGKLDKDTPIWMAKKLHRRIKDSGLVVYEDAGHFSYIDRFNEYVAVVNAFAEKLWYI